MTALLTNSVLKTGAKINLLLGIIIIGLITYTHAATQPATSCTTISSPALYTFNYTQGSANPCNDFRQVCDADNNGACNLQDLRSIQRYILGYTDPGIDCTSMITVNGYLVRKCDVNGSSSVTASDLTFIRKYILGYYCECPALYSNGLFTVSGTLGTKGANATVQICGIMTDTATSNGGFQSYIDSIPGGSNCSAITATKPGHNCYITTQGPSSINNDVTNIAGYCEEVGICGTAAGVPGSYTAPTTNLCSQGTVGAVTASPSSFSRSCGDTITCSKPRLYRLTINKWNITDISEGSYLSTIHIVTPTRTNYTFNGWFTAETGGTQVTSPVTMTNDISIWERWSPASRIAACSAKPANTDWNTVSAITQTWDGSTWQPSANSSYNTTASTSECRFQCAANYSFNGEICVANSCSATAPTANSTVCNDGGTPTTPNQIGTLVNSCSSTVACDWTCSPGYTRSGSTCVANIIGSCGTAYGKTRVNAPSGAELCASGTATAVSGTGPWTWSCNAAGGNASCSTNKLGQPTSSTHLEYQTSITRRWNNPTGVSNMQRSIDGITYNSVGTNSQYNETGLTCDTTYPFRRVRACDDIGVCNDRIMIGNGYTTACNSCSSTPPATNSTICNDGPAPGAPNQAGVLATNCSNSVVCDWICSPGYTRSGSSCVANVTGSCGTANGRTRVNAPSGAELCTAGTATTVSGTGPWTWSCNAAGGNASCSTNKLGQPTTSTHLEYQTSITRRWNNPTGVSNMQRSIDGITYNSVGTNSQYNETGLTCDTTYPFRRVRACDDIGVCNDRIMIGNGYTTACNSCSSTPPATNSTICNDGPAPGAPNQAGVLATNCSNSVVCDWICSPGYTRSGSSCVANTQITACTAKPANTSWNTVSSITQTWNGSTRVPSENSSYNTTASTTECRYICSSGFAWNGSSCVANVTGSCGTANGRTRVNAPSGGELCTAGTATTVSGTGPWTWSCNAAGGNASCSTNRLQVPSQGTHTVTYLTPLFLNNLINIHRQWNIPAGAQTIQRSEWPNPIDLGLTQSYTEEYLNCLQGYGGRQVRACDDIGQCTAYNNMSASFSCACGTANISSFVIFPTSNLCNSSFTTNNTGTTSTHFNRQCNTGNGNVSCQANRQYTVTFNGNGGSGTMPIQAIIANTSTTLNTNTFTRAGYQFLGWDTNQNVTTPSIVSPFNYTMGTNNVNLYAIWQQQVPGTCGTANGKTRINAPSGGELCTAGTATAVSGTGPWTWSCNGIGGNASCSTNKLGEPTNLQRSAGQFNINWTWTNPTGVTNIVWRNTTSSSGMNKGINTNHNETGLTCNNFFTDRQVRACDDIGTCSNRVTFSGITTSQCPTFPVGGNITNGSGAVIQLCNISTSVQSGGNFLVNNISRGTNCAVSSITKPGYLCQITTDGPSFLTGTFNTIVGECVATSCTGSIPFFASACTNNAPQNGTPRTHGCNTSSCRFECNVGYTWNNSNNTCEVNSYTATFDGNGGTGHTPTSKSVVYNTAVGTLPTAPTRAGHTFSGWFTAATGGTAVTTATVVTANVTYYAQWSTNSYTATFDGNGGTGHTPTSKSVVYNTAVGTLPTAPTRAGHTFSGWFTAATGGTAVTTATVVTANVTYYAQWSTNSYTATFDGNGGTGHTPTSKSVVYNTAVGTLPTAPTRAGHTFSGWFTAATGGTAVTTATVVTANVTYYAQWSTNSYTATFDGNGGTGHTPTSKSVVYNTAVGTLPTAPTRAGHTFSGWFTAATGGTAVTTATVVTANVTYYAQWSTNSYTATFDGNGGTGHTPTSKSVVYNTAVGTLPTAPTRAGHTFSGWFTAATGGTAVTTATVVTANVTYYAQWSTNSYTATFDGNGGTGHTPTSKSVVYNTAVGTLPTAPTRAGHTFSGWFTAATGGTAVTTATVVTANVTYYAQWSTNSYTATFNGNGGTGHTPTSKSVVYNTAVGTLPTAPTRAGHTFSGWFTAATGGTAVTTATVVTANVTYYAQWSTNSYTATFDGNGGTGHTPTSKSVVYNTAVGTLPTAPTRAGHTFSGWFTAATGGTAVTTATVVTANVTYYAQWSTNSYTATFDGNGGTGHTPTSKSVVYNTAVGTLPTAPTRAGHTFSGWFTAATGGTAVTTATVVTANVTYYAQWSTNSYTATFDGNGGTGHTPTSKSVVYNTAVGTLPTAPTRAGHTFSGWFTAATGGTAVTTATVVTGNVTYYAQWSTNSYTATFDGNGGTGHTPTSKSVVYNTAVGTLPTAPTRAGHTFSGWFTAATGGTAVTTATVVTANVTYYAQWSTNSYTATFDGNGGTGHTPTSKSVVYNTAVGTLPTAPTRAGHTFSGWFTAATGGTAVTTATVVTANVTYYAQWSTNSYTATFDGNGGTGHTPTSKSVVYNTAVGTLPTAPTRAGHTFSGWFTAATGGTAVTTATVVTANVTYYAQWSTNSYTATFDGNGGTGHTPTSKSVVYNTAVGTLPTAPTRAGHTFSGWFTGATGGTAVTTATVVTGNVTYYAQWSTNSYTATFDGNGGTGHTPTSKSVVYNTAVGTLPTAPTRAGHTFSGWFTAATGGTAVTTATVVTANVTYYAQWSTNSYTATFDGNGGTGHTPTSKSVVYNTAVGTLPTAPTRAGHTFSGWFTAATGGTAVTTATVVTANVTYYAQWSTNSYTATFNGNGGTGHTPTSKSVVYNTAVGTLPTAPTRAGHTFSGWFTGATGGTAVTTATVVTGNVTYYAQWSTNSYTITFNTIGGTAIAPANYNFGSNVNAPTAPTRTGYAFSGWSPSLPVIMPANNVTVTAQWMPNSYQVAFNNNDSNGTMSNQTFIFDEAQNINSNLFTKTGYTFIGWNSINSETGAEYTDEEEVINLTSISGSIVQLYAIWNINKYSISGTVQNGFGATVSSCGANTTVQNDGSFVLNDIPYGSNCNTISVTKNNYQCNATGGIGFLESNIDSITGICNLIIDGQCNTPPNDTSVYGSLNAFPDPGIHGCNVGIASGYIATTQGWTWQCLGIYGGQNTTCAVERNYCGDGNIDTYSSLFNKISGGNLHTCALDTNGEAWCRGDNSFGQLGTNNSSGTAIPVKISGFANEQYTNISAGEYHTCTIDSNSRARCRGDNGYGQLGNNSLTGTNTPVLVAGNNTFIDISAGVQHTCAVDINGNVRCRGNGANGRLGNNSTNNTTTPVAINMPVNTTFIAIDIGRDFTCALSDNGNIRCRGANNFGQLGNNSTNTSPIPVLVQKENNNIEFTKLDVGNAHACSIDSDGKVRCRGAGSIGRLGNGTTSNRLKPTLVSNPNNNIFTDIAAGALHTCALDDDGNSRCRGRGSAGQIGQGVNQSSNTPVASTMNNQNYYQISAGNNHSCSIDLDHQIWCRGNGANGRLGNGDTINRNNATLISVTSLSEMCENGNACLENCTCANGYQGDGDGNCVCQPVTITSTYQELTCTQRNIILSVSGTTANTNYLRSNGSTGSSITITEQGTYEVTVNNEGQCQQSDSIIILDTCTSSSITCEDINVITTPVGGNNFGARSKPFIMEGFLLDINSNNPLFENYDSNIITTAPISCTNQTNGYECDPIAYEGNFILEVNLTRNGNTDLSCTKSIQINQYPLDKTTRSVGSTIDLVTGKYIVSYEVKGSIPLGETNIEIVDQIAPALQGRFIGMANIKTDTITVFDGDVTVNTIIPLQTQFNGNTVIDGFTATVTGQPGPFTIRYSAELVDNGQDGLCNSCKITSNIAPITLRSDEFKRSSIWDAPFYLFNGPRKVHAQSIVNSPSITSCVTVDDICATLLENGSISNIPGAPNYSPQCFPVAPTPRYSCVNGNQCQQSQYGAYQNLGDCSSNCPAIPANLCTNGIQDAGESGIDCGGSCPTCPNPVCLNIPTNSVLCPGSTTNVNQNTSSTLSENCSTVPTACNFICDSYSQYDPITQSCVPYQCDTSSIVTPSGTTAVICNTRATGANQSFTLVNNCGFNNGCDYKLVCNTFGQQFNPETQSCDVITALHTTCNRIEGERAYFDIQVSLDSAQSGNFNINSTVNCGNETTCAENVQLVGTPISTNINSPVLLNNDFTFTKQNGAATINYTIRQKTPYGGSDTTTHTVSLPGVAPSLSSSATCEGYHVSVDKQAIPGLRDQGYIGYPLDIASDGKSGVVTVGDMVMYQITVENDGPEGILSMSMTDVLPSYLELVHIEPSLSDTGYAVDSNTITRSEAGYLRTTTGTDTRNTVTFLTKIIEGQNGDQICNPVQGLANDKPGLNQSNLSENEVCLEVDCGPTTCNAVMSGTLFKQEYDQITNTLSMSGTCYAIGNCSSADTFPSTQAMISYRSHTTGFVYNTLQNHWSMQVPSTTCDTYYQLIVERPDGSSINTGNIIEQAINDYNNRTEHVYDIISGSTISIDTNSNTISFDYRCGSLDIACNKQMCDDSQMESNRKAIFNEWSAFEIIPSLEQYGEFNGTCDTCGTQIASCENDPTLCEPACTGDDCCESGIIINGECQICDNGACYCPCLDGYTFDYDVTLVSSTSSLLEVKVDGYCSNGSNQYNAIATPSGITDPGFIQEFCIMETNNCTNGANNAPLCNQCPNGQVYNPMTDSCISTCNPATQTCNYLCSNGACAAVSVNTPGSFTSANQCNAHIQNNICIPACNPGVETCGYICDGGNCLPVPANHPGAYATASACTSAMVNGVCPAVSTCNPATQTCNYLCSNGACAAVSVNTPGSFTSANQCNAHIQNNICIPACNPGVETCGYICDGGNCLPVPANHPGAYATASACTSAMVNGVCPAVSTCNPATQTCNYLCSNGACAAVSVNTPGSFTSANQCNAHIQNNICIPACNPGVETCGYICDGGNCLPVPANHPGAYATASACTSAMVNGVCPAVSTCNPATQTCNYLCSNGACAAVSVNTPGSFTSANQCNAHIQNNICIPACNPGVETCGYICDGGNCLPVPANHPGAYATASACTSAMVNGVCPAVSTCNPATQTCNYLCSNGACAAVSVNTPGSFTSANQCNAHIQNNICIPACNPGVETCGYICDGGNCLPVPANHPGAYATASACTSAMVNGVCPAVSTCNPATQTCNYLCSNGACAAVSVNTPGSFTSANQCNAHIQNNICIPACNPGVETCGYICDGGNCLPVPANHPGAYATASACTSAMVNGVCPAVSTCNPATQTCNYLCSNGACAAVSVNTPGSFTSANQCNAHIQNNICIPACNPGVETCGYICDGGNCLPVPANHPGAYATASACTSAMVNGVCPAVSTCNPATQTCNYLCSNGACAAVSVNTPGSFTSANQCNAHIQNNICIPACNPGVETCGYICDGGNCLPVPANHPGAYATASACTSAMVNGVCPAVSTCNPATQTCNYLCSNGACAAVSVNTPGSFTSANQCNAHIQNNICIPACNPGVETCGYICDGGNCLPVPANHPGAYATASACTSAMVNGVCPAVSTCNPATQTCNYLCSNGACAAVSVNTPGSFTSANQCNAHIQNNICIPACNPGVETCGYICDGGNCLPVPANHPGTYATASACTSAMVNGVCPAVSTCNPATQTCNYLCSNGACAAVSVNTPGSFTSANQCNAHIQNNICIPACNPGVETCGYICDGGNCLPVPANHPGAYATASACTSAMVNGVCPAVSTCNPATQTCNYLCSNGACAAVSVNTPGSFTSANQCNAHIQNNICIPACNPGVETCGYICDGGNCLPVPANHPGAYATASACTSAMVNGVCPAVSTCNPATQTCNYLCSNGACAAVSVNTPGSFTSANQCNAHIQNNICIPACNPGVETCGYICDGGNCLPVPANHPGAYATASACTSAMVNGVCPSCILDIICNPLCLIGSDPDCSSTGVCIATTVNTGVDSISYDCQGNGGSIVAVTLRDSTNTIIRTSTTATGIFENISEGTYQVQCSVDGNTGPLVCSDVQSYLGASTVQIIGNVVVSLRQKHGYNYVDRRNLARPSNPHAIVLSNYENLSLNQFAQKLSQDLVVYMIHNTLPTPCPLSGCITSTINQSQLQQTINTIIQECFQVAQQTCVTPCVKSVTVGNANTNEGGNSSNNNNGSTTNINPDSTTATRTTTSSSDPVRVGPMSFQAPRLGSTVPQCSIIQTPSINRGEILPMWRGYDYDKTLVSFGVTDPATQCNTTNIGTIPANSLMCTFALYNGSDVSLNQEQAIWSTTIPCLQVQGRYDIEQKTQRTSGMTMLDNLLRNISSGYEPIGKGYVTLDPEILTVLGDYQLRMERISWTQCDGIADDGTPFIQSHSEESVCVQNLIISDRYVVQEGFTMTTNSMDETLNQFRTLDGSQYKSNPIQTLPYQTTNATAMLDYISTYIEELAAIPSGNIPATNITIAGLKKITDQEIYVYAGGDVTLGPVMIAETASPFTLIITNGDLTINGSRGDQKSIPSMIAVTNGEIKFQNQNCEIDITLYEGYRDIIYATLITKDGFSSNTITNNNANENNRCHGGNLTVYGMMITPALNTIEDMARQRRSIIDNIARYQTNDKLPLLLRSAALRIINNPRTWTNTPPQLVEIFDEGSIQISK